MPGPSGPISAGRAGRRMASVQRSPTATGSASGVPLRLAASDADQVEESPGSAHENRCGRSAEGMQPVVEREVDVIAGR
jgi:hypothetical protein